MSGQGTDRAPAADGDLRVSIVYTGRSLGALGVLRAQDEHELLTEQANAEGKPFRLVSHACWRAPGLAVFLPSSEPEGDELDEVRAARSGAERHEDVPALRSNNVLLFQDPTRSGPDLLAMLRHNPRAAAFFPDLAETRVRVSRLRLASGERALIVEEPGAEWPGEAAAWTTGEMNRVDIEDSRLFELPVNLGQIGPRATVLARVLGRQEARSVLTLVVDLGQRDGDLGVERPERARIDFTALARLGYSISVPFEFELALGAEGLAELRRRFPSISFLAANVKAKDASLFEPRRVVEVEGVKIGLIGLVDPDARGQLPRERLSDFAFEPFQDAAYREARALRLLGADAVVVLSNLHPRDNALLARDVAGLDAIVADLHVRWSPESLRTEVELVDRPASRPGSPALVARGFANGLGVGRLDLVFRARPGGGRHLASLSHALESVTDRTPADTSLVAEVQSLAQVLKREKGELMVPAFVDLVGRRPELAKYDDTAAQGRISKRMWEEFLARLLRRRGSAEIAIIRKLPHFPPLIGKLHEQELRGWLWTEDRLVTLDLQGVDLKKVLLEDARGDLVVSGIDRKQLTVMGRRLDEQAFYRVATTDVLFEGARFRDFEKARRVRKSFRVGADGRIVPARSGASLGLREIALIELARQRSLAKGDAHLDRVAGLLAPDPPFEKLLTFTFDHPTLWMSASEAFQNEGYGAVPESRVTANDSKVVGSSGRFRLTQDRRVFATDLGATVAYSRQSATLASGVKQVSEAADDLKLDLTLRPKTAGKIAWNVQPFVRGLFDTEFTPTVNPSTGKDNRRQLALRGVAGGMFAPRRHRRMLELGLAIENDFQQQNLQLGFQARADFVYPIGPLGRVSYRMRNDALYFFPTSRDRASHLALRYNMVHEVVVPLVDELSLSIAADVFIFKGKVDSTHRPAASVLLRVGLTYDRLWKPRYQPLF